MTTAARPEPERRRSNASASSPRSIEQTLPARHPSTRRGWVGDAENGVHIFAEGGGDKSAHNRRFLSHAPDLVNIQGGVRAAVQELIQISNVKM